jgi:hypothetical protein
LQDRRQPAVAGVRHPQVVPTGGEQALAVTGFVLINARGYGTSLKGINDPEEFKKVERESSWRVRPPARS